MANPDITKQSAHVAGAEHVPDQAVTLVHMESVALRGNNPGRILPAMLEHQQPVV